MLVLKRRKYERIIVPLSRNTLLRMLELDAEGEKQQLVIALVDTCGPSARIGIEAPNVAPVHREEIWKQIQERDQTS